VQVVINNKTGKGLRTQYAMTIRAFACRSPSYVPLLVRAGFLRSDEILKLFLLALKLSERHLRSRSALLDRHHLLLALLHEAVAENACDGADSKTNPEIALRENRTHDIHPPEIQELSTRKVDFSALSSRQLLFLS